MGLIRSEGDQDLTRSKRDWDHFTRRGVKEITILLTEVREIEIFTVSEMNEIDVLPREEWMRSSLTGVKVWHPSHVYVTCIMLTCIWESFVHLLKSPTVRCPMRVSLAEIAGLLYADGKDSILKTKTAIPSVACCTQNLCRICTCASWLDV